MRRKKPLSVEETLRAMFSMLAIGLGSRWDTGCIRHECPASRGDGGGLESGSGEETG